MNSGTRSLMAGPPPGMAVRLPPVRTARPADPRRRRRPVVRPWPLFSGLGPLGVVQGETRALAAAEAELA